jgi:hypothetical protein
VFKNLNKENIINLIESIYPDYLNEYAELQTTEELSINSLLDYLEFSYIYNSDWLNRTVLDNIISLSLNLPDGIEFDDFYKLDEWYLKQGKKEYVLNRSYINDNVDKVKKAIDPDNRLFFLFSLHENPNYEMQQELESLGVRYHLG